MRKNEYNSLEAFTSQYVGVWGPSDGHWLSLEFSYQGKDYRFATDSMHNPENTILPDGRESKFDLYEMFKTEESIDYTLLEEYATMEDGLESTIIGNRPFSEVIMDDDTEILGQD